MGNDALTLMLANMRAIAPELALSATILLVIVYDLLLRREHSHRSGWVAMIGVGVSLLLAVRQWGEFGGSVTGVSAFSSVVVVDRFGLLFKILFLAATIVVIGMSLLSGELWRIRAGEYYSLLLTATLGSSFMVSSANLLMLFLALETLSLSSYVLAGYRKGNRQAAETALKYVLFGSVASGVLIYGLSILYGLAGSLQFDAVAEIAPANHAAFMLVMVLLLAGFGFKMSAVPFHFWAPDVYEGAPTPITAFLSVVSKAAGFAALLRLIAPFFDVTSIHPYTASTGGLLANRFDLVSLFWIVAVLTMVLGNFVALRQTDMKRLLAYSSIAHAGYLITAFVAANHAGFQAILFYFVVYFIANLGLFLAVIMIQNRLKTCQIASYRGLIFRSPTLAICMGILLWSLIGLPPSAGFVGKWKLFYAVIQAGGHSAIPYFYYALVLVALATSVVSLYYYIAVLKVMCFYQPESASEQVRLSPVERVALLAFAIPILVIQLNWEPITAFASEAMNARASRTEFVLPHAERVPQVSRVAPGGTQ